MRSCPHQSPGSRSCPPARCARRLRQSRAAWPGRFVPPAGDPVPGPRCPRNASGLSGPTAPSGDLAGGLPWRCSSWQDQSRRCRCPLPGSTLHDGLGGDGEDDADLLEVVAIDSAADPRSGIEDEVGQLGAQDLGLEASSARAASRSSRWGGRLRRRPLFADLTAQLSGFRFPWQRFPAPSGLRRWRCGPKPAWATALSDVNVVEGFDGVTEGESHVGAIGFGQDPRSVDGHGTWSVGSWSCDVGIWPLHSQARRRETFSSRRSQNSMILCGSVPSHRGVALRRLPTSRAGIRLMDPFPMVRSAGDPWEAGFVEGFLGDPQASGAVTVTRSWRSGKRHGSLVVAAARRIAKSVMEVARRVTCQGLGPVSMERGHRRW